jgi:signal transduction histidine kinase
MAVACLALALAFLAVVLALRTMERERADRLLLHYEHIFRRTGTAGLQAAFAAETGSGASFLRLEGDGRQLILVRGDSAQTLPDFTAFPPSADHVWHGLQKRPGPGCWTVRALAVGDDLYLQVGMDAGSNIDLLRRIALYFPALLLALLPLCLARAWYTGRTNRKNLHRLSRRIRAIAAEGRRQAGGKLQPDSPDEAELVASINQLLARHRQLTRELQESLDNVAHDLRTPVTRLRSIAEYGLRKGDDNDYLRKTLADCLEESDRLLAMLNTMLNVTEAEAGTLELDLQPVSLQESIGSILELYGIIAEEQGVSITGPTGEDLSILADPRRIGQVWANLLDNAIKYGADRIDISVHRVGDMAEIRIRDNGMGISPAELDRIWSRLFRGDRSRSKPGLGLGLTLVKAMVENHGGTITAASALDKGTTFTVTLPLADRNAGPSTAP